MYTQRKKGCTGECTPKGKIHWEKSFQTKSAILTSQLSSEKLLRRTVDSLCHWRHHPVSGNQGLDEVMWAWNNNNIIIMIIIMIAPFLTDAKRCTTRTHGQNWYYKLIQYYDTINNRHDSGVQTNKCLFRWLLKAAVDGDATTLLGRAFHSVDPVSVSTPKWASLTWQHNGTKTFDLGHIVVA